MSTESLVFNGINGATGSYLLPKMTTADVTKIIRGETLDEKHREELEWYYQRSKEENMGPKAGVDPKDLAQAGWGVIFAHDADPAVREALSELLAHRKQQAGQYYREYTGAEGYRYDAAQQFFESKMDFLARHGAGPGPADPEKVPYYLLIVGDPETIPYLFQYQLDVQYAVGRIHFDKLAEYAQYAHSVVAVEQGRVALPRQATFFGVRNADDPATNLSADYLVKPLAEKISQGQPTWAVQTLLSEQASKEQLAQLLGGAQTPALLFTASHGMGFPKDDPRQLPHQGALLCQNWPGPQAWQGAIPEKYYLAADDIGDNARLLGLLAFHFACYGAGTPRLDDFAHRAFKEPTAIAPHAFLANLPKRLLSHPKGGALAVVGHIERAWGYSFMWEKAGAQLAVFESTLELLMNGYPVGSATEFFNVRYAELSTEMGERLKDLKFNKKINELELAGIWTANNDARSYVIIGDPAVRLPVGNTTTLSGERPMIETITIQTQTTKQATPVMTAGPTSGIPEAAVDYGIMDSLKQAQASLTNALQQFSEKLCETLKKAIDDVSSLEVATYVSDDMSTVTYDFKTGQFTGTAKLRALTHIKLDGDTMICVPEKEGVVDQALWAIHADMVKQAQTHRAELLKTLASVATGVLDGLKKL